MHVYACVYLCFAVVFKPIIYRAHKKHEIVCKNKHQVSTNSTDAYISMLFPTLSVCLFLCECEAVIFKGGGGFIRGGGECIESEL